MSDREPPFRAATFATSRVAASLLCLCAASGTATAAAHEPDVGATTARTDPATPSVPVDGVATEMNVEARAHYDRGLALYAARDFAAAVQELERGFAVDPRREFLFAEAQALRLAGDCPRAVPLYLRFLETDPSAVQIEAARLGIDRCGPNRSPPPPVRAPVAAASPAPPALPAAPPPAAAAPAPERAIWWHDAPAVLSIGAGVAALGAGAGFFIASNRAWDDAMSSRTMTYGQAERLFESAQQRRAIAVFSTVGGALLLAAGSVRLVVLHRRERMARQTTTPSLSPTPAPSLSWAPAPGGGALIWETGF